MITGRADALFLAIDAGMSGVKAALVTADGRCVAQHTEDLAPDTPQPGWSELDLSLVWDAVVTATREVAGRSDADLRRVRAVGLSTASPTVVAVDQDGAPLQPGRTYADSRAAARLAEVRHRLDEEELRRLTGNRLALPLCSAVTMLDMLDDVEHVGGARVGHLNSYIGARMTGRWAMDWTNASYTGLTAAREPERWSAEAFAALEFPTALAPELLAPWETLGPCAPEAAQAMGLERSVVVVMGAADTACSAYAVGCLQPGDAFESIGTSGVLTLCRDRPGGSPVFMNRSHVVPGRWLSHGAMSTVGAALQWLSDKVLAAHASDPHATRSSARKDAFTWLEHQAAQSPPGAGGIVFLPYLAGERTPVWDPDARGAWVGLSLSADYRDLARAVLEAAGYGMRQMLDIAKEDGDQGPPDILSVGGGARSRFWTGLRADITRRRYWRAADVEAAARGAAMLATVGAQAHQDVWAAAAAVEPLTLELLEATDDQAAQTAYDQNFQLYSTLYTSLRQVLSDTPGSPRTGSGSIPQTIGG